MAEDTINTITWAAILIVLLIVVLFYFFGQGFLPKIAHAAENFADNSLAGLRNYKIPAKETQAETDKEILGVYDSVLTALNTQGNGPCWLAYSPLPSDFKGYKISLAKVQDGIFAKLTNKDAQIIKTSTIAGKASCLVSGQAAQQFYKNYLGDKANRCTGEKCTGDYTPADIELSGANSITINGKKSDLKDLNLLFKASDGNICFLAGLNYDNILLVRSHIQKCSSPQSQIKTYPLHLVPTFNAKGKRIVLIDFIDGEKPNVASYKVYRKMPGETEFLEYPLSLTEGSSGAVVGEDAEIDLCSLPSNSKVFYYVNGYDKNNALIMKLEESSIDLKSIIC